MAAAPVLSAAASGVPGGETRAKIAEQLFGIDGLGRPHFTGATASAAGGGSGAAAAGTGRSAAGFIEVLVGGKVRKLAFYE